MSARKPSSIATKIVATFAIASDGQRADTTLEVRPDRTETCQYYAFY